MTDEEILRDCQAYHPLVRTHHVTGAEGLFLSEITEIDIEGMHPAESGLLLGYFEDLMDDPNFQVRWHWRPYDIAIWDETSTNHRALSDHFPQYRLMRRTTVGGAGTPFYRPAEEPLQ
jgi:taurine dioxygenase